MRFRTTPATIIGIALQTHPVIFQIFLRHSFGRRAFSLFHSLLVPFLVLQAAFWVRLYLPREVVYAPLRLIPPFNADPANQALMESPAQAMAESEVLFFLAFILLFVLFALGHYLRLTLARWRKTDPVNTRFWGESWLGRLPGFRRLRHSVLHCALEPAFVFALGYGFCAVAPAFGMYLMGSAIVLAIEHASVWRTVKRQELDARDALVNAEVQRGHHEAAQAYWTRAEQRATSAISASQLARVQKNPQALLPLSVEETRAACEALGSEAFEELVDRLAPEAQEEIHSRFVGFMTPRPADAQTA